MAWGAEGEDGLRVGMAAEGEKGREEKAHEGNDGREVKPSTVDDGREGKNGGSEGMTGGSDWRRDADDRSEGGSPGDPECGGTGVGGGTGMAAGWMAAGRS